jgi:tRNA nucleotidyltransferase (CCA-adding enzyme)
MQKLSWKPNTNLEKAGAKIVRLLNKQKFQAFFVGGIVRDYLLKKESDNLDIATDAKPDEVEKILNSFKINFKPIGKKFGTILAIVNGQKIEITTFRREGRYTDTRHPDQVEFIREYLEDARRRDLTINAFYFNPVTRELFDPTNGLGDLKAKIIRFVGDPKKRIDEDPLRMIRAVRLATVLGFKLERNSFAAIKTRAKLIQTVSGERIKAELDKILLSKHRIDGIKLLDSLSLLKFIIPEVEDMKKFKHESKLYHLEGNMFIHALMAIEESKVDNLQLFYALFFHDISKPFVAKKVLREEGWVFSTKGHADASANIFLKFASRLKFSRHESETIEWLIRNHMLQADFGKMRLEKQIKLASNRDFKLLLEHWRADHFGAIRVEGYGTKRKDLLYSIKVGKELLRKLDKQKNLIKKFASGEFIMHETRLKPGIQIGQIAEKVKIKIVRGEIKNESDAKNFLGNFQKKT